VKERYCERALQFQQWTADPAALVDFSAIFIALQLVTMPSTMSGVIFLLRFFVAPFNAILLCASLKTR